MLVIRYCSSAAVQLYQDQDYISVANYGLLWYSSSKSAKKWSLGQEYGVLDSAENNSHK